MALTIFCAAAEEDLRQIYDFTKYWINPNQKTHPRSPSLILKRGGKEDLLFPFSSQEKGRGMSCKHSDYLVNIIFFEILSILLFHTCPGTSGCEALP